MSALALALAAACGSERASIWPTSATVSAADALPAPAVAPAPAPVAPDDRPSPPEPYAGPSGEDIEDLCDAYAVSKADIEFRERRGGDVRRCRRLLTRRSRTERQAIADCANLCNESGGYVACFDDFGTPEFPACAPGDLDDGTQ